FGYVPGNTATWNADYGKGVDPTRFNYVAGVSLSWNLLSPFRVRQQTPPQRSITAAYRAEYDAGTLQFATRAKPPDDALTTTPPTPPRPHAGPPPGGPPSAPRRQRMRSPASRRSTRTASRTS